MIQQTRSGRVIKQPVRYVPQEVVEDDYATEDYDSDESEVTSEVESSDEELDEDDDDDEEMNDFVVDDEEEEEDEEGEEPATDEE